MSTCAVAPTDSVTSDSVPPTDDDTLVLVFSEDESNPLQNIRKSRSDAPRTRSRTPPPADRMRKFKRNRMASPSHRSPLSLRCSHRWRSLPPTGKPLLAKAKRTKSLDLQTQSRSVVPLNIKKLKAKMKSLFDAPPRNVLRTPSPSVKCSKSKPIRLSSSSDTSPSSAPHEYPRLSKLSSKSKETLSSLRRLHQRYLKDKYQLKWRKKKFKTFMESNFSLSSPKLSTLKRLHSKTFLKSQLLLKKNQLKAKLKSLFDTPSRKRMRSPSSAERSRLSKRLRLSSSSDATLSSESQTSSDTSELEASRDESLAPETQSHYLPQSETTTESLGTSIESQNRISVPPSQSEQLSQRYEHLPSELSPSVQSLLPMTTCANIMTNPATTALSTSTHQPLQIRQSESQRGIVMSGCWNVLRNQFLPLPRRLSQSTVATESHLPPLSNDTSRLELPPPQSTLTMGSELLYSSSSELPFSSLSTRPASDLQTGLYQSPLQIEIPPSSAITVPEAYQWPLPTPPCQLSSIPPPPIQLPSPCDPLLLIPFPSSDSVDTMPDQESSRNVLDLKRPEISNDMNPKDSQSLSQSSFGVTGSSSNSFSSLIKAQPHVLQSTSPSLSKLPSPIQQSPSGTRVVQQYDLYKLPIRKRALTQFYMPTLMSKSSDSLSTQKQTRNNSPPLVQPEIPDISSMDVSFIPLPPPQSHTHAPEIRSRKKPSVLCSLPCVPQLLERFQSTKQSRSSLPSQLDPKREKQSSNSPALKVPSKSKSTSQFPKDSETSSTNSESLRSPKLPQQKRKPSKSQMTTRAQIQTRRKLLTEIDKSNTSSESSRPQSDSIRKSTSKRKHSKNSSSKARSSSHSNPHTSEIEALKAMQIHLRSLKVVIERLKPSELSKFKKLSPLQSLQTSEPSQSLARKEMSSAPTQTPKGIKQKSQLPIKSQKPQTSTPLSLKFQTLINPIEIESLESKESRLLKLTPSPEPIRHLPSQANPSTTSQSPFVSVVPQSLAPNPDPSSSKPKILEHIRLVPMQQDSTQQPFQPDSWSLIQVPTNLPPSKKPMASTTSLLQTLLPTQSLDSGILRPSESRLSTKLPEPSELNETTQNITNMSTKTTQTPTRPLKSKRTLPLDSAQPSVQNVPIKQRSQPELSTSEFSAPQSSSSTQTSSQFALSVDTLTSALSRLPSETSISIEASFLSSSTEPVPQQTSPWHSSTESLTPIRLPAETSISLLPPSTEQVPEETSQQTSYSMQSLMQLPPETSISLSSSSKLNKPTIKQQSMPKTIPVSQIPADLMMQSPFQPLSRNPAKKQVSPTDLRLELPSQNQSEISAPVHPELTITVKERISYRSPPSTQMKEQEWNRRLLATEALISMSSGLLPEPPISQASLPSDSEIQTQNQTEKELLASEALMLMSSQSTYKRKLARRHSTAESLTSTTSGFPPQSITAMTDLPTYLLTPTTDHTPFLTPSYTEPRQKRILSRRCSTAEALVLSCIDMPSDSSTSKAYLPTHKRITTKEHAVSKRQLTRRHSTAESLLSTSSGLPSDSSKRTSNQTYPELPKPMLTRLQARLLTNIELRENPKTLSSFTKPLPKRMLTRRHSTAEPLVSPSFKLPSDPSTSNAPVDTKNTTKDRSLFLTPSSTEPIQRRVLTRRRSTAESLVSPCSGLSSSKSKDSTSTNSKIVRTEDSLFVAPSSKPTQKRRLTRRHSTAEPLLSTSGLPSDLTTTMTFTPTDKKIATKEDFMFPTPSTTEPIKRRILTRRRSTAESLLSTCSGLLSDTSTTKATYSDIAKKEDSLFLMPSPATPLRKRILSRRHSTAESLVSTSSGFPSDSSTSYASQKRKPNQTYMELPKPMLTRSQARMLTNIELGENSKMLSKEDSLSSTPSFTKPIQKQKLTRRHSTAEPLVSPSFRLPSDPSISKATSDKTTRTITPHASSTGHIQRRMPTRRRSTAEPFESPCSSMPSNSLPMLTRLQSRILTKYELGENPKILTDDIISSGSSCSSKKITPKGLSYRRASTTELLSSSEHTSCHGSTSVKSLMSLCTQLTPLMLPETLSSSSKSPTPSSPKPSKPKSTDSPVISTFPPDSTTQSDQIEVRPMSLREGEPSLPPSSRIVSGDGTRNLPSG